MKLKDFAPVFCVAVGLLIAAVGQACATKERPLAPGGAYTDPKVYNFDLATNSQHQLLQTFLDWEKANNVRARYPAVGKLADDIRLNAPAKFKKAEDAKKLYESLPRTPEGASDLQKAGVALQTAIQVLQALVQEANSYMLKAAVEGALDSTQIELPTAA